MASSTRARLPSFKLSPPLTKHFSVIKPKQYPPLVVKNPMGVNFVRAEYLGLEKGISFCSDTVTADDCFNSTSTFGPILPADCGSSHTLCFRCSKCNGDWPCFEVFETKDAGESPSDNVVFGYAAGVFRTRACYFFYHNNFSMSDWQPSSDEDMRFRTFQATNKGVAVKISK